MLQIIPENVLSVFGDYFVGDVGKNREAMIILYCGIVNGVKNKNIKNSLGAMWNASHLAVRLCVLRH